MTAGTKRVSVWAESAGVTHWYEPFAGTAAVGLAAVGLKPLANYSGTKTRFSKRILQICGSPKPTHLVLRDVGLWGRFWEAIAEGDGERILAALREEEHLGAGTLYFCLKHRPWSPETFLALQRLNFKGKPVGRSGGAWQLSGLDSTSAYGVQSTMSFSAVKPLLPSTIRKLADLVAAYDSGALQIVEDWDPATTIVYMDPPYEGDFRYPGGHATWKQVLEEALGYSAKGALVVISYNRAFRYLEGAEFFDLSHIGSGSRLHEDGRNGNKRPEWLTVIPRGYTYKSKARSRLSGLRSRRRKSI